MLPMTRTQKKTIEYAMVNLEAVASFKAKEADERSLKVVANNASSALREMREVFPQQAKRVGNNGH